MGRLPEEFLYRLSCSVVSGLIDWPKDSDPWLAADLLVLWLVRLLCFQIVFKHEEFGSHSNILLLLYEWIRIWIASLNLLEHQNENLCLNIWCFFSTQPQDNGSLAGVFGNFRSLKTSQASFLSYNLYPLFFLAPIYLFHQCRRCHNHYRESHIQPRLVCLGWQRFQHLLNVSVAMSLI